MTTETGPFCSECQIHRVMSAGSKCPVCIDRRRQESER